jgi:cytidine deaminase
MQRSMTLILNEDPLASGSVLLAEASQGFDRAYVPYSKFPVGAAVLAADGRIFSGVNIENASYGLTICAERVALFAAIAAGASDLRAIAVAAQRIRPVLPCGACRQVMSELMRADANVFLQSSDGSVHETTVGALLPAAFTPKDLAQGNAKN